MVVIDRLCDRILFTTTQFVLNLKYQITFSISVTFQKPNCRRCPRAIYFDGVMRACFLTGHVADDRRGLVDALKMMSLKEQDSEFNKRIEALKGLQRQHNRIEKIYRRKRAELKDAHLKLLKTTHERAVGEFWLLTLKRYKVLAEEITECDEGALKHLKHIGCRTDNSNELELEFFFSSNPYFTNSVLTKTFHTSGDNKPKLEKTFGTEIEWCPGKSLTQKENRRSFFNFFKVPDDDSPEKVQSQMEHDYDIGSTIRDKIIHKMFTGEEAVQWDELKEPGRVKAAEGHQAVCATDSVNIPYPLEAWRFDNPISYLLCELDLVNGDHMKQRASLETKYWKFYQPFYKKRYEIVNNITEVGGVKNKAAMDQGVKATPIKKENKKGVIAAEDIGVPNFWLTAMKNNKVLADKITEMDEKALKYLKDITWCWVDNKYDRGFKMNFFFRPNPFFKNSVLTISYQQPPLWKATGTEINWCNSKNFAAPWDSFFNLFCPPQLSDDNYDDYDYDYDDDNVKELEDQMKQNYYIGKTIRDKIIPHAMSWFTREALEEGGEFEDSKDELYSDVEDDEPDTMEDDEFGTME